MLQDAWLPSPSRQETVLLLEWEFSLLFKEKRKVLSSQTAKCMVCLLFLFCLELEVLTVKEPGQRMTERLDAGLGPWDWHSSMDEETDAQGRALSGLVR